MNINTEDKLIAQTAARAFGGEPTVTRYWDDAHVNFVDILACQNSPWDALTSYSTIGTSKADWGWTSDNVPLRVEIVGACASQVSFFPNILATCSFQILNSGSTCYPGAIFRNLVSMYSASSLMRHILFVSPFLWDAQLQTLVLADKKVAWLSAVPISDAELQFVSTHGTDELETRFEQTQINIFDLERTSAV